jgi:hypothetical protein
LKDEGRGKGLLHLGPGGLESRRTSAVAGVGLVLDFNAPGVVPLGVAPESSHEKADVASLLRAGSG